MHKPRKRGNLNYLLLALLAVCIIHIGACARSTEPADDNDDSGTDTQNWEATRKCDTDDGGMPRFMNFSNDGTTVAAGGRRLVSGLGSQEDFYKFSLADDSDIKRIDLTFSQSDWWAQLTNNYITETEIDAIMSYNDGTTIRTLASPVGVRFKGFTSYSNNTSDKKSFNINIDYRDPGQDINGFNSLNLNCAWGDNTFMREVIYEHINRRYIPALSVNYVDLYINGEYWGIYINSQQINDDFYRQWFTSTNGTSWRAEPWNGTGMPGGGGGFGTGTSSLNYLGDTPDDYTPYYTMKRYCIDDPWSYLIDLCSVLQNSSDLENETSQVLDLDRTLWFLVMENVFDDTDSYVMKGGMDYYIYWDYTTGLFTPIEYDGNALLIVSEDMGRGGPPAGMPAGTVVPAQPPIGPGPGGGSYLSWGPFYNANNASYPLLNRLLNVPAIRQRYLAHMRTVLKESFNTSDLASPDNIISMIDAYAAKIGPFISADPKTFITDLGAGIAELKKNIQTRYAVLMGGTGGDGVEYPGNPELMAKGLAILDADWQVDSVLWAAPGPADKVVINASVSDPDNAGGIDSVFAYVGHGLEGNFTKSQMFDDGSHEDGPAGDGVFGIILDEQASGTRTRFYIEAVAGDSAGTRTYYPARAEHDVFTFVVN